MSKLFCERCGLVCRDKYDYNKHINRKIPCLSNNNSCNNKNKEKNNFECLKCKKFFARNYTLKRHNEKFHSEINGDNNNLGQIDGCKNTQINGNNNTLIINPIINIHIHNYEHNDINDLSLFEQYISLTSESSPYTALLDHLNLNPTKSQYHNIKVKNINKNTIDIHNGEKWIKEVVNNAISNIIDSKRIMIGLIFNRFRCFLSRKATHLIPKAYFYGFKHNFYFHKKLIQNIKVHLYNNRNHNTVIDEDIPNNSKDHVFWALSKRFRWTDVERLITKMDELQIDFDKDLSKIKKQINQHSESDKYLSKIFKPLIKQIDKFITLAKNDPDNKNTPESSTDSSNNSDSD